MNIYSLTKENIFISRTFQDYMVLYDEFHYYWALFEVINGIVISLLAILDVYALSKHRKDKAPLVEWALSSKESKNNFSILLFSAVLFVVVFIVYSYGSVSSNYSVKMLADLIGTFTYLMVSYVIFKWSKVFMRFI